ncbi:MAG: hypothetical protein MZW92_03525, partial [Comamonadaceae bacterium]|nr:hypothetical protein [Comamonadaceae bacterium]
YFVQLRIAKVNTKDTDNFLLSLRRRDRPIGKWSRSNAYGKILGCRGVEVPDLILDLCLAVLNSSGGKSASDK